MPTARVGHRRAARAMTRVQVVRALIALVPLATGACTSDVDRSAAATELRRSAIEAWLSCDECENGERAAVRALGDAAVEELDRALGALSPQQRANIDARVLQSFRLIDTSTAVDTARAARYRANFIAVRQQRAAIALGDIGTPSAIAALRRARDEAQTRGYRPDVLRVIESVITAGESQGFYGEVGVTSGRGGRGGRGGGGVPNSAGFGEEVSVHRDRNDTIRVWNGDETIVLRGGPYPTEVFTGRIGDSVLTFIAVGDPGAYTIEVGRLGTDDDRTQGAPLRITSARPALRGPGAGAGGALTLAPATFPVTKFITLGAHPDDTVDHYRVQPPGAMTLRARVESRQVFETASVRWLSCVTETPLEFGDVLRGIVIDEQEAPVGNARVEVVGTSLGATTTATGTFSLNLPSNAPVDLRVSRIDYRPVRHYRIQPGVTEVRIGLVSSATSEVAAVPRFASTLQIPAGECRVIQVGIPRNGTRRIVRLVVESP